MAPSLGPCLSPRGARDGQWSPSAVPHLPARRLLAVIKMRSPCLPLLAVISEWRVW